MRLFTTQRTTQFARSAERAFVRFIVLEEGASRFEPPSPSSDTAMEVTVLVQAEGEASFELEARALRRLAQLERSDRVILEAVIAAGAASAESRARLSRALMTHIASHGSGEIVLAAGDSRAELRHELMTLAETLTHTECLVNVGVRVLFTPEPREEAERAPRGECSLDGDWAPVV